MKKSTLETYLDNHPEMKYRRFIPRIVEEITGVSPEKQIEVKVAIRRLQELIPNDEYGKKKEEAWREDRGMVSQGEFVRDGIRYRIPTNTGANQ